MQIAGQLAGFSMGQADILRKAMGKKKKGVMEDVTKLFVDGAVQRGVRREVAEEIFDLIAKFAGYGFNKSHSASYAVLSVRTAWLKAHFPAAFLAATLTSEMNNTDRIVTLVDEARKLGISILPPDVNTCTADFKAQGDSVRFGLGAVKNVGRGAIEAIVEAREKLDGGFHGLYEFCEKVDGARVNRRVIESLILAGAMDSLPGSREQKLAGLDAAMRWAARRQRDQQRGQRALFEASQDEATHEEPLPEVPEWTEGERLAREKEVLGLYLTGHPLNQYRRVVDWLGPGECRSVAERGDDQAVTICGVLHGLKTVTTRSSGRLMAFLQLEDFNGSCEVICFPDAYEEHRALFTSGEEILFVAGRVSSRSGEEAKVILEKAYSLPQACSTFIRSLVVRVPAGLSQEKAEALVDLVHRHPGRTPLHLRIHGDDFEAEVDATRATVSPVPTLLLGLVEIFGEDAVAPVCLNAVDSVPQGRRKGGRPSRAGRALQGGSH